ncbi:hypothetical protein NC651_034835 [Populus alba x Populus x berolinensis]|nr:hypothetical protein NC651_034835 [Populus alba x Populus x berolinensis]
MFFTLRTSPVNLLSIEYTILILSSTLATQFLEFQFGYVTLPACLSFPIFIQRIEMEERKWEDLEFYCLVNVLGRVGMESLLLDVPFVCKSWYRASLDPSCWKHLVFPKDLDSEWDLPCLIDLRKI